MNDALAELRETGPGEFAVVGALGFATVPAVYAAAHKRFAAHRELTVDLAGVARCDSSALALLLEWRRLAVLRGATLRYRNLPAALVTIAAISDCDPLLPRA
jgi:phospholipid transport system transporter-binding protein